MHETGINIGCFLTAGQTQPPPMRQQAIVFEPAFEELSGDYLDTCLHLMCESDPTLFYEDTIRLIDYDQPMISLYLLECQRKYPNILLSLPKIPESIKIGNTIKITPQLGDKVYDNPLAYELWNQWWSQNKNFVSSRHELDFGCWHDNPIYC